MARYGVNSYNVKKCVDDSFHKVSDYQFENDNVILAKEKESQKKSGLKNFPQIMINGQVYNGSLS